MESNSAYLVDLQVLDRKIEDLSASMRTLEHEIQKLRNLREFVVSNFPPAESPNTTTQSYNYDHFSPRRINLQRGLGISKFIIMLLRQWDALKTRDIIAAYGIYTSSEPAVATNNVNNALVRLKDKQRLVEAKQIETERGSWWSLTTKGRNMANVLAHNDDTDVNDEA